MTKTQIPSHLSAEVHPGICFDSSLQVNAQVFLKPALSAVNSLLSWLQAMEEDNNDQENNKEKGEE